MARRLNVNREAVRTLAVAVGVREAARQCNLSEELVMKWSQREGWLKPAPVIAASEVRDVRKPFDALAIFAKHNRLSLAKASAKAAKKLSHLSGDELIQEKTAQSANAWTNVASKVHGWEAKESSEGSLSLKVLAGRIGRTRVAIETEGSSPA
jgi:hypothetical protein